MITNFETITVDLTDDERKMAEIVIHRFLTKPGMENIVTNEQISKGLKTHYNVDLAPVRVRKIIQFIRVNNLRPGLIGTSRGYYYTEKVEEIEKWILSMMQRERAIAESRRMAENHLMILKRKNHPTSPELPMF